MQKDTNTPPQLRLPDVEATQVAALVRRRLLLRGLSKGAVAAAAAVPLHTLASTQTRCETDGKNGTQVVWATVSGSQSAVGSRAPTDTLVSEGFGATHYAALSNWPGYQAKPGQNKSISNTVFRSVFAGASGTNASLTCYTIVTQQQTSPECRWVLAYLNATTCEGTNYPYTTQEVLNLYQNGGSNGNPTLVACETFFGTYMESLT